MKRWDRRALLQLASALVVSHGLERLAEDFHRQSDALAGTNRGQ